MYFSHDKKKNVKPVYPTNIAVDRTLCSSSNECWHNDCEISILFWDVWCSVYKLSNIYAVIKKQMAIQTTIFYLANPKNEFTDFAASGSYRVNTETLALCFTNANSLLTTASLKHDETEHSDIDLLIMSVIWGTCTNTELSHSLSRLVGKGS